MPKKPPKNGYFYFMLDFKDREERLGRRFVGGMTEVADAASDEWKTLPQHKKDRYNAIAKEHRKDPRPNIPKQDEKRFNSQGISFAQIEREKREKEERIAEENRFISNFVNDLTVEELKSKYFYLIHVNIFCKTDQDIYYPAELAIARFSLKDGIVGNVFHRYIDPGDIATGYSLAVKEHSENTHKLTLQFVRSIDGTRDIHKLYHEMSKFLLEQEKGDKPPPLFTMYDDIFHNTNMTAVKKTLKQLWEDTFAVHEQEDNWKQIFKVLPLPTFFMELKNKCVKTKFPETIAIPNSILATPELQKDKYNFELNTACKFHKDEDAVPHCSRSFVIRWCYIIIDNCCEYLGINYEDHKSVLKSTVKEEYKFDEYASYHDDDEEDRKSMISKCSNDTSYAESSVSFSKRTPKIKEEKFDDSYSVASQPVKREIKPEIKEEPFEYESAKSCPAAWPCTSRKKEEVPTFDNSNFPALGFGRGALFGSRNKLKEPKTEK